MPPGGSIQTHLDARCSYKITETHKAVRFLLLNLLCVAIATKFSESTGVYQSCTISLRRNRYVLNFRGLRCVTVPCKSSRKACRLPGRTPRFCGLNKNNSRFRTDFKSYRLITRDTVTQFFYQVLCH